ncbi:tail fiber assembly protein [Providencia manganoxydans]|uniref:tail fiber assembly protein n=1 Tax=Providencia manganoxydans TaxID=2923283 RepID=UPI0032DB377D
MKYYKDTNLNVYAYDDEQLDQVTRLTEVESLLQEKEPNFIEASQGVEQAVLGLNNAKAQLDIAIGNTPIEGEETDIDNHEEVQRLTLVVEVKTAQLDEATIAFNQIESEYQPLKNEFDAILPVFFDIRENIQGMKKMSTKEVEAYLNPPVSKEQLIAEAEQQKQSLLAEANNAIAPLQDAVELGMATEDEVAALQEWKKYRVLLNRVDTSTAPDIDWPEKSE